MDRKKLALTIWLTCLASVRALIPAPPTIPVRLAVADRVIVGEVTQIADKLIPAEMTPKDARRMHLATVAVGETVFGPHAKEVQVGFFSVIVDRKSGKKSPRRSASIELNVGEEALFYLTRHPTRKDLFVAMAAHQVTRKQGNPTFSVELELARKGAKLLADPQAGLAATQIEDRYLTAAMLITRYRTERPGSTKTTPIPSEQSKALLTELADADWTRRGRYERMLNPAAVFLSLGLGEKEGWTLPRDAARLSEEAKKWLRANAGTYRIQRFVWPGESQAEPPR